MNYRIFWIDATSCRQPGRLFSHYKVTADDGEWKDVGAWDFIKSTPLTLKKDIKNWLKKQDREIDVFSVTKKYGKKIILTEEDL